MNQNPESTVEKLESEHIESSTPIKSTTDSTAQKGSDKPRTPDVIFALVKNSTKLNIVVEGPTDHNIYKTLIESLGIWDVDYYEAGGRDGVFAVYRLIKNYNEENLLDRVAFIVDQDSWVFLGLETIKELPKEYSDIYIDDIIWTDGYSIENDLYVCGKLSKFVDYKHKEDYDKTLDSICAWYAFEILKNQEEDNLPIDKHLEEIIPKNCNTLKPEFLDELKKRGFDSSCPDLNQKKEKIKGEYEKYIRGKNLFQLLQRFLKKSGIPASYSDGWNKTLAWLAITVSSEFTDTHPIISSLQTKVKHKLTTLPQSKSIVSTLIEKGFAAAVSEINR